MLFDTREGRCATRRGLRGTLRPACRSAVRSRTTSGSTRRISRSGSGGRRRTTPAPAISRGPTTVRPATRCISRIAATTVTHSATKPRSTATKTSSTPASPTACRTASAICRRGRQRKRRAARSTAGTPTYNGVYNSSSGTAVGAARYAVTTIRHDRCSSVRSLQVNRPIFFRRALMLSNGATLGSDAVVANRITGLTIVSENPVYIQGDWNAGGRRSRSTTCMPPPR